MHPIRAPMPCEMALTFSSPIVYFFTIFIVAKVAQRFYFNEEIPQKTFYTDKNMLYLSTKKSNIIAHAPTRVFHPINMTIHRILSIQM